MARSTIRAVWCVLLLVFGGACRGASAAGGGGAANASERRACERINQRCQGNDSDLRECERMFADMRATGGGEANSQRTIRCMNETNSCGGGAGCRAAGASRSGTEFVRDFVNGFTR